MLTIKVILAESGAVADLHKNFPLFQKQFNNVLLSCYVPVSILAPNFTVNASADNSVVNPFVAGSAVKVGIRAIERNGKYKQSNAYYMRFVKTIVKDGIYYALFERKCPKEFTFYAGQGVNAPTLIFNVENIEFGEITSATATSNNAGLTVSANLSYIQDNLIATSQNYLFVYESISDKWYLNNNAIELSNYGVEIESGTPEDQDEITLSVIADTPTTISIATTQTVSLDVMPSADFEAETIPASEYSLLEAYINQIIKDLLLKQDITDYALQTENKTVVGAINELVLKGIYGEDYIGTYNYSAEDPYDLPSDAQMLAYVKSIRGNDYTLKNGDTVIVIQQMSVVTDRVYKYIYNGTTWGYYEIPPVQAAQNGVNGIVRGTYNTGEADSIYFNVAVDIENGAITHIYVKNALGEYEDLTEAYMPIATGATKQFVKSYALPRQFNDVLYLSENGYTKEAPTSVAPIFDTQSAEIGDHKILTCDYTVEDFEFQLASKNSFIATFWVSGFETGTFNDVEPAYLRLETLLIDENLNETFLASAITSTKITLTSEPQKITFNTNLDGLENNAVVNVTNGCKIRQELFIFRESSTTADFACFSNSLMSSVFYLNVNIAGFIQGEVVQETGSGTTVVMSQKATTDALSTKVPTTRTVNGHELSSDVTVTKGDVALGDVVNTGDSALPVENGTTKFTTGGAYTELNKKADKVSGATNGNLAGLDGNGNLTDSGKKASDFLPSSISLESGTGADALQQKYTGTAEGVSQAEAKGEQSLALGVKRTFDPSGYTGVDADNALKYMKYVKAWYANANSTIRNASGIPSSILTASDADLMQMAITAGIAYGKRSVAGGGSSNFGNNAITLGYMIWNSAGNAAVFGNQNVNEGANALIIGLINYNIAVNNLTVGALNENKSPYGAMIGENNTSHYYVDTFTAGRYLQNFYNAAKTVLGLFNLPKEGMLLEIGNGTDNANRSNAFEVTRDGIARTYGTISGNNDLTPKKYVDGIYKPAEKTIADGDTLTSGTVRNLIQAHKPIKFNGLQFYYSSDDSTNYMYFAIEYDSVNGVNKMTTITVNKSTWIVNFYQ